MKLYDSNVTGSLRVSGAASNESYFLGHNVGVGTNNPRYKLHVVGDSFVDGQLTIRSGVIDSGSVLYTSGSNKFGNDMADEHAFTGSFFATASEYNLMGGNVGIGTRTPAQPLHIYTSGNGGIELDGVGGAPSLIYDIPGNEQGRIYFQENDTVLGGIVYETSGTDYISFKVAGSSTNVERLRITGDNKISGSSSSTGSFGEVHASHAIGIGSTNVYDAALYVTLPDGNNGGFTTFINNADTTDGQSNGLKIRAGSNSSDFPLWIEDHDAANILFQVTGDAKISGSSTSTGSFGRAYLGEQVTFSSTQNKEKILLGETDIGIANKDGADMVLFADTNGEILFADGGRTGNVKMAIDFAAGGVSIGNNVHSKTPPTSGLMVEGNISGSSTSTGSFGRVHVKPGSAGSITYGDLANMDDLIVENSNHTGITILSPADKTGHIVFGDPDDEISAQVSYDHDTEDLYISTEENNAQIIMRTGNASEALRIDSNKKVGIGTSSPATPARLHVVSSSVSGRSDNGGTVAILERAGHAYLQISTNNSSYGGVLFGDDGDSARGMIAYDHSADKLYLRSAGTSHFSMDSSGHIYHEGNISGSYTSTGSFGAGWYRGRLEVGTPGNDRGQSGKMFIRGGGLDFYDATGIGLSCYGGMNASSRINTVSALGSALGSSHMVFKTRTSNQDVAPTERMRLTASGSLGIGTAVPLGKLHIFTGETDASAHSGADELVLEGTGDMGISFLSATGGAGVINFGDSGDNNIGSIEYQHSNNSMKFTTNTVAALTLDSSQNATFGGNVSGSSSSTGSFGTLGVGTTGGSNGYGLHIKSSGNSTYPLYIEASDGSNLGGLFEGASGNGSFYVRDASGTVTTAIDANAVNTSGDIVSTKASGVISGSSTSTGSFGRYHLGNGQVISNDSLGSNRFEFFNDGALAAIVSGSGNKSLIATNLNSVPAGAHGLYAHTDIGDARITVDSATNSDAQLKFVNGGSDSWTVYSDGSDTNDPLRFYDAASSTVAVTFDNGKVGIGSTSPDGLLDVAKSAGSNQIYLDTYSTTDGHNTILNFQKSANATIGTAAETADGEALGLINFKGVDNGGNFDTGAGIQVVQVGSAGSKVAAKIQIFANSSTTSAYVAEITSTHAISGSSTSTGSFGHLTVGPSNGTEGLVFNPLGSPNNTLSIYASNGENRFSFRADNAGGDARQIMYNNAATSMIDLDTGGGITLGAGMKVSGSATSTGSFGQLHLIQDNSLANPTLNFGDGDSGFYESSDDVIRVAIGGAHCWQISSADIRANATNRFGIQLATPTSTVPVFTPNVSDTNTGIGYSGTDVLSLIAGGVGVEVTSTGISGSSTSTGSFSKLELWSSKSGSEAFTVDGVNGRLFSVTDEMSGSVFSVTNDAGLPMLEAFSDSQVNIGPYSKPIIVDDSGNISGSSTSTGSFGSAHIADKVGIGITAPSHELHVHGNMVIKDDGYIGARNAANSDYAYAFLFQFGDTIHINPSDNYSNTVFTYGEVGIGTASPVTTLDIHSAGTENAATFGMADDGNSYIVGRVGEVQGRYSGIAFMVGSAAVDGWGSSNGLSIIRSGVVNDGGTLQGDIEFLTNGGDSLTEKFNIAANGDLTGTDTSIGSISDERTKQNIQTYSGSLSMVNTLRPVTFEWKSDKKKSGTRRGFIAQEITSSDAYWVRSGSVNSEQPDYEYLTGAVPDNFPSGSRMALISKLTEKDTMYVSAIQELTQAVRDLRAMITGSTDLNQLKAQVSGSTFV